MDIKSLLHQNENKDLLRFTTAGSVDDGKSTLIGRLLFDSKTIYEDHIATLKKDSSKHGSAGEDIDYALLLDGLKAEREQGITIDVAYRYFSTPNRKFIIADTPGHEQYTRNMVTGASTADLAIILIDASRGILPQTKRHTFLASLLGIKHILVTVNKMDLVNYSQAVFEKIKHEYSGFVSKLEIHDIHFIPVSALKGDNIIENHSDSMPWYTGQSVISYLETVHISSDRNLIDLRFPVQYVNRPNNDFRGFAGSVASGVVRVGDKITALPSGQQSKVKSIVTFDGNINQAFPPMSVTLTLEDEIDISRGDMITHIHNVPKIKHQLDAIIVWMNESPMDPGRKYLIKQTNSTTTCAISECCYKFDINNLHRSEANTLELNEIGRVLIDLQRDIIFDSYTKNRITGSFILIDYLTNLTVAAGMISDRNPDDEQIVMNKDNDKHISKQKSLITYEERANKFKQHPSTIWLTGLPMAGKTSIAYLLEKRLFDLGYTANVLDGENMRLSLSSDLHFSEYDRSENTRRTASVATLFNENGIITIVALVSPYSKDRIKAKNTIGDNNFILTHLDCPEHIREKRDTKKMYSKAKNKEIKYFSGVSAPYEAPEAPDLYIATDKTSLEESVDIIMKELKKRNIID